MRHEAANDFEQRADELAREMADAGMSDDAMEAMLGRMDRQFEMRREFNEHRSEEAEN